MAVFLLMDFRKTDPASGGYAGRLKISFLLINNIPYWKEVVDLILKQMKMLLY
jgi:hypothetical protein